MMAALRPYPAMKASGIEWLGDVPEHWGVRRLKTVVANVVDQAMEHSTAETHIALENVESWTGMFRRMESVYLFDSPGKRFRLGDVLFGKLRPYLAKVIRPQQSGVCVSEFLVLRPKNKKISAAYMEQLLRSKKNIDAINAATVGAKMPRAEWSFLSGMGQPLPPFLEQIAIVRYLHHVNSRVLHFVRSRQKLIDLLNEQKQVIIHHAVTRGLDPDVPLKPSGLEWLDEVPTHWHIRQLARIGRFFKGSGGTKGDSASSGIPCVRYGDLYEHHHFYIRKSRTFIKDSCKSTYTSIQYGDVLFAGSSVTSRIGESAVNLIESIACCGGDVILFRPSIKVNARFFGYATDCSQARFQKVRMGRGITVMHIYSDELKYMFVVLPPLVEQNAIVEYLEDVATNIDAAIAAARREIDLVREFQARLIADVVTGKIDVREVAAALPNSRPFAANGDSDDSRIAVDESVSCIEEETTDVVC